MINVTISNDDDEKTIFYNVDAENIEKIIRFLVTDYCKKEICFGLKYPGYCEDCIYKMSDLSAICNNCTKDDLFNGSSPSKYKSLDTLVKKSYEE